MHNMMKLFLSVFVFTFGGFAAATHAQQVNTLFAKQLPETPDKEMKSLLSITRQERSAQSTGMMRMQLSMFSKGKLRCRCAVVRFSGLVPVRYFTNHLKTFIS
jgi:hypothetical protein